MTQETAISPDRAMQRIDAAQPVLIAGPTASGKSDLALRIADRSGGVIVNADASQVYECWRVITARPSRADEGRAPHLLYGHVSASTPYSTGHWLREVRAILATGQRPVIVGGTGLYLGALTRGLAEIPQTAPGIRAQADGMGISQMLAALDSETTGRIDTQNRARVQRAWEVLHSTGRGLAHWQDETPPADVPLDACQAFVVMPGKDWLNARIARRFDLMLDQGAMEEIAAVAPAYDPALPAHRAIGVPELMAVHAGTSSLAQARERAIIATRQFAKRQRTWFRSKMRDWQWIDPA